MEFCKYKDPKCEEVWNSFVCTIAELCVQHKALILDQLV